MASFNLKGGKYGIFRLSFIIGYFVMYSIRAGTKTRDAFESFLGFVGLTGTGALALSTSTLTTVVDHIIKPTGWGIAAYFALALILSAIYSYAIKRIAPDARKNATEQAKSAADALKTAQQVVVQPTSAPIPNGQAPVLSLLPPAPAAVEPGGWSLFACILGRVLLGEGLATLEPKS